MRILHIITSLRTGGAEKLMVDLLPRLRDLGNEVELLVFDGIQTPFYSELDSKGIKINQIGMNCNVYNPLNIIKLIPYLNKFDIIHTHNTAPQLFVAIASLFTKHGRLFTTEHNTTNRRRDIKGFVYIDQWMYNRYNKIICISDQAEANLREYLKSSSNKIFTIYNGIDIQKFIEAEPIKELQEQFKDCHLGIMVAGFRDQKDQTTLIKAYKLLPKEYHLLLVGTGENEESCKLLAKELQVDNRVHFMGMRTDIPQLLHTADTVIMSSHYEGLSLSSIEGMASGNPFIASDVDGLHEVVEGAGILFPHGNEKSLADEIKKLSDDTYRKNTISLCQKRAKLYDISVMASHYNNTYHF